MRTKKIIAALAAATLLCGTVAGCGTKPVSLGTAANTLTVSRASYLASKGRVHAQDISNVIAFIDTLESVVGDIGDYTTSYDPDTNTVYATTATGNIAFALDDKGYVQFASASGSPATKERLSQGIVQVTIGNAMSNKVSGILNQVEQTKWLNSINANVIAAEMEGFEVTPLDTSMMYFETPALAQLSISDLMPSDLEREVFGTGRLEMPVLTESLSDYGIEDLTNYYESPTLVKFWPGVNMDNITAEVDKIINDGIAVGESFADATLEKPQMEIPEWTLGDYKLPSSFSDGTSTNLGSQTLDAYNNFYSSLSSWKDQLISQEIAAQQAGMGSITQSDNAGKAQINDKINSSKENINNAIKDAQQNTANKNNAASNKVDAQNKVNAGKVDNHTQSGLKDSADAQKENVQGHKDTWGNFNDTVVNAAQGAQSDMQDYDNGLNDLSDALNDKLQHHGILGSGIGFGNIKDMPSAPDAPKVDIPTGEGIPAVPGSSKK